MLGQNESMITKYKNRSLLYFACAVALTAGLVWLCSYLYHTRYRERHDGLAAIAIFGYLAAWILWMLVGFNLARAKGYSRDFTGVLFVVVYILGFCVPILVFAFPIFILFGLEDKSKMRRR
jgi:hypothetical protein